MPDKGTLAVGGAPADYARVQKTFTLDRGERFDLYPKFVELGENETSPKDSQQYQVRTRCGQESGDTRLAEIDRSQRINTRPFYF